MRDGTLPQNHPPGVPVPPLPPLKPTHPPLTHLSALTPLWHLVGSVVIVICVMTDSLMMKAVRVPENVSLAHIRLQEVNELCGARIATFSG